MSRNRESQNGQTIAEVPPLFADENEGATEIEEIQSPEPAGAAHRRVRAGELYYVADDAAPEGWSIVEIGGVDERALAAFSLGQLEAIPLDELEGRILAPVPQPSFVRRAA